MCNKIRFIEGLQKIELDNIKYFYKSIFLELQKFLKKHIKKYNMKEDYDYIIERKYFKYTLFFFEI